MATIDPLTTVIWEEIAEDLSGETREKGCRAAERGFYEYLKAQGGPFAGLEEFKAGGEKQTVSRAGLLLGWRLLEKTGVSTRLERIFSLLKPGGEARLYGYYSRPSRDDIILWEGKFRRRAPGRTFQLPAAKALSLGDITGYLKTGPFDRYLVRKNGIYYQAVLSSK